MAYYFVPGTVTPVSNAFKTNAQLSNTSGATKRGKVCEVNLGTAANPNATDTYIEWDISRISGTGSAAGTTFTPDAIDPADGAAVTLALINATTESSLVTANSNLKHWGMNQRNSLRWVAQQESQMLVFPNTTGNGLVLRATSSTFTSCSIGTLDFME
jgi:hypothetical protein